MNMVKTYNDTLKDLLAGGFLTTEKIIELASINKDAEMATVFDDYFIRSTYCERNIILCYLDSVSLADTSKVLTHFFNDVVLAGHDQNRDGCSLTTYLKYSDAPRDVIFSVIASLPYKEYDKNIINDVITCISDYEDVPKEKMLEAISRNIKGNHLKDDHIIKLLGIKGIDHKPYLEYASNKSSGSSIILVFYNCQSPAIKEEIIDYIIAEKKSEVVKVLLQNGENTSNHTDITRLHDYILTTGDILLMLECSECYGADIARYSFAISQIDSKDISNACQLNERLLLNIANFCDRNVDKEVDISKLVNIVIESRHPSHLYSENFLNSPKYVTSLIYSLSISGDYVFASKLLRAHPEFTNEICESLLKNNKYTPYDEFAFFMFFLGDDSTYKNKLLDHYSCVLKTTANILNKDEFVASVTKFLTAYPMYADAIYSNILKSFGCDDNLIFQIILHHDSEQTSFVGYDSIGPWCIYNQPHPEYSTPEFYENFYLYDVGTMNNILNYLLNNAKEYVKELEIFLPIILEIIKNKALSSELKIELANAVNVYKAELKNQGNVPYTNSAEKDC